MSYTAFLEKSLLSMVMFYFYMMFNCLSYSEWIEKEISTRRFALILFFSIPLYPILAYYYAMHIMLSIIYGVSLFFFTIPILVYILEKEKSDKLSIALVSAVCICSIVLLIIYGREYFVCFMELRSEGVL